MKQVNKLIINAETLWAAVSVPLKIFTMPFPVVRPVMLALCDMVTVPNITGILGNERKKPLPIKYTGGATFTCSDTATAKAVAKRTYEAAVELFASLCKQYSLDPMKDGVIISHKEGCARGVASNHGDPEHLWNQLGTGYTMNGFRKAVQAAMKGGGVITTPNTGNAATGGTGATVKPYLVRVTISDLYIRKGPGTNYGKNGFIKPGVYTIVAESTGAGATKWGKLKSGAGWISLDYAKAV